MGAAQRHLRQLSGLSNRKPASSRSAAVFLQRRHSELPSRLARADLSRTSIRDTYSVDPSIRPMCTRCGLTMANMIQVCSNFRSARVLSQTLARMRSRSNCFRRCRFRAKREQLGKCPGFSPEGQGQNLAVTVVYVPGLLDSGHGVCVCVCVRERECV